MASRIYSSTWISGTEGRFCSQGSFRVTQGLCLHSHASKCALAWGIPPSIVQRAEYVSEVLNQHEINVLLDEAMSDKEREELQKSEQRCRRFLEWDLSGLIESGNFEKVVNTLGLVVNGPQEEMGNS
jgi:DNA mismatch repair protein MSH5